MAVQFTDFSRIPTQEPAFANLLGDMLQGYKTQREPTRIRQEEESRLRDNAIKAIQQKFLPEEYKASIGLKGAQSRKAEQEMRQIKALMDYLGGRQDTQEEAQPSTPGLAQTPASTPQDFKGIPFRMNDPGVNEGQPMNAIPRQQASNPSRDQAAEAMSEALRRGQQQYQKEARISAITGGKIPLPKLQTVDGTTYALGTQGRYPVAQGQTPQQQKQQEVEAATDKLQSKMDLERAQALREQAQSLKLGADEINAIHELLTGNKPLKTGIKASIKSKLGYGSKEFGEFLERAQNIQSEMTHDLSARGGQGAARIVAAGKVSGWKGRKENLGLSDAYANKIKNKYELLNQEYKTITGQDLPYSLPEYVYNIAKTIHGSGSGSRSGSVKFTPRTTFDSDKEYHDYMTGLSEKNQDLVIKAIKAIKGS